MASMHYFNGVDSVSISKRLGHAQVSTTANIYAHVMEETDQRNADILADVFLNKACILERVELKLNYSSGPKFKLLEKMKKSGHFLSK